MALGGQARPKAGVGGNPSGENDFPAAGFFGGQHQLSGDKVADRLLERGAEVVAVDLLAFLGGVVQCVQHGGFQAGKAEVKGASVHPGMGEGIGFGIAPLGGTVNGHAARVGVTHGPGSFVKGFAGGVVPGAADDPEMGIVQDLDDVAVSPGGHHAEEGRFKLRMRDVVGGNMGADVVGRNQGLAGGHGKALGVVNPNQQRADEPRRVGDGDGVQPGKIESRLLHGGIYHPADVFTVAAGGDLRHNAAVFPMLLYLGGDDGRPDLPAVDHYCRGSFIAGAFNCQNFDFLFQNGFSFMPAPEGRGASVPRPRRDFHRNWAGGQPQKSRRRRTGTGQPGCSPGLPGKSV